MRPHEIFAAMSPERAEAVLGRLSEQSPAMFAEAVQAAATALKSRPQYLMKQPFAKRAAAVRRTLARVAASAVAEEILAVYFLECRKEILIEWLELIGLEHEEGMLKENRPESPPEAELSKHVETFRSKEDEPDRELLLQAFAAQGSIDWPALQALIQPESPGRSA